MAVFVLALLTGMGTALLFLSQHEARMGQASLRGKQAFYLAEAGLEDARVALWQVNSDGDLTDDLEAAAGVDDTLDFDPNLLQVSYDADGEVTGIIGFNDDAPLQPLTTLTGSSPTERGWYAAFLTNDAVDGVTNTTDTNDRVMITSVGARAGNAVEVVDAIVEPYHYLPPVPGAAITLLGPLPSFDNGNSNAQNHSGDNCNITGGPYAPIVGTVSGAANTQVQNDMLRPDRFHSGPYSGADTVVDLTDPTDPVVIASGQGAIDPGWLDCLTLKGRVVELQQRANFYCNSDVTSCAIPATAAPDSIVFIDGDLTSTPNGSFSGILVVTGKLTYNGNTGWDGVVMAVGEGHIDRSGGGNDNPTGGVILANIDPSPNGPRINKSDWCSTSPDGFQQAIYETSGGGTSTVTWCSDNNDAANSIRAYRVVEFLQR
jgi:hypothetical protein